MKLDEYRDWHRPMLACAGVMVVMAVVSAVGLAVDDRLIAGAPAWLKPFKFAVSFAVYALSWAWLVSLLRTRRRLAHTLSTIVVAVILVEYAIITLQVVRGTRSHFNFSTSLDGSLFKLMGVSIAVMWIGTLVLTLLLLRTRIADTASRWAVRLGTVISLLGLSLGGLMVMPTPAQRASMGTDTFDGIIGAHSVGVPDGGPSMPITGWSTVGGDLRIPHFVGMHALQALPLLVMALTLLSRRWARLRDDAVRGRLLLVAGFFYGGVLVLVTWQALRGQPLTAPDVLTLTALAALVGAATVGTAWALRRTAVSGGDVSDVRDVRDVRDVADNGADEAPVLAGRR
ncbi:hypothetical protein [Saccharomonospora cyanea]|uniref:Uncharacterized protein n=1 Tax=Saccharomonospora cyanea NA-134 TaxID=882082 RepID=H5XHY6_9PSEU|nr:hypothetical protein [Saccharomonospora cyanea]EHR59592.1 hypothetical protein SaccyDRAFT_0667 [Saccharomonospora cyanea NA-134]